MDQSLHKKCREDQTDRNCLIELLHDSSFEDKQVQSLPDKGCHVKIWSIFWFKQRELPIELLTTYHQRVYKLKWLYINNILP